MRDLFIGLMSGTSMDAIDAALVDFSGPHPQLIESRSTPLPAALRERLEALVHPDWRGTLAELGQLDAQLGEAFADAACRLLEQAELTASAVTAIGSHGQTVFHAPAGALGFSIQIGDPNRIAARTGITTVADFRRRDIAVGGQGAPLVPAFHRAVLQDPVKNRVILNLGGIANITCLPADPAGAVIGFDTGPGNTLLDAWIRRHRDQPFDADGAWAASGNTIPALLTRLLADPYFALPAPKSTGRELFHLHWLDTTLDPSWAPADVQATLLELTAVSIAEAITRHCLADEVIVCGGGSRNTQLMARLSTLLPAAEVKPSDACGVPAQWMESMAFAWLARETLNGRAGNLPSVTGAQQAVVLGGIFPGHAI